mmetsp:Transcript_106410/g.217045  ORF Transcript_106410/g.217045 Transcript_106410/m.217045 type:complete len:220 (-) Transcript_106410:892-1551(-)
MFSQKKINFHLSNAIKRKIYFAETALGDQILASDTRILEFTDYGKQFITFNKMSPDSYVQMSMMLAYYRLYGKIVCAYEPVLTKGFFHGRTEAMRPATMEAKHLCEMFCDVSSTPEQKLTALQDATRAHSKLVRECAQGKGVDRHLFALKCIAKKKQDPGSRIFSFRGLETIQSYHLIHEQLWKSQPSGIWVRAGGIRWLRNRIYNQGFTAPLRHQQQT